MLRRILLVVLFVLMSASVGQAAGPRINRLIVFGDSYSSVNTNKPFYKWSTSLFYETKQAKALLDRAVGGSTGGNYGSPTNDTFGAQVARFLPTTPPHSGDVTVVYFGYNDMTRSVIQTTFPGMPKILGDYRAALSRLVAAGYASSGRKLLVVQPHDWSRVPRFTGPDARLAPAVHRNILAWNEGVAAAARTYASIVIVVDLFTAMECVFRQPRDFGFANVTDMRPRSASVASYLYDVDDRYHVGGAGQKLIRNVMEYYLANGAASKARLLSDMAAGRVFPGVSCR